jgi:hypothetical protein
VADERVCALDGTRLAEHARCWRCALLFGPLHEEARGEPARLGLCRACFRGFARWASGGGDLRLVEVDEPLAGRWVTPTQAAPRLQRSPATVRRMARNGALPSRKLPRPPGATDRRGDRYLVLLEPDEEDDG